MFDFLKRKKNKDETSENEQLGAAQKSETSSEISSLAKSDKAKNGLFHGLKQGLAKTRAKLTNGVANLFLGKKELTPDLLNEIEMLLLSADLGVETTEQLIQNLTEKLSRQELKNTEAAFHSLQDEMKKILRPYAKPLILPNEIQPFVILVVGINGSGKTTTIGKLTHFIKAQNKNVLLAAGDTFRAAAIEQLQVWGERNQVAVIAQQPHADTAAVIYDAMEAAKARKMDVLIADTAGRLHTQTNLMTELQKVNRVLRKIDPTAPHETLIILDATLGQNTLTQVKQFNEALGVSGIVLTKLDGTAKGGIVFSVVQQTKIPIRFIGIGESIEDLRPFDADAFVDALFND